MVMITIMVMVGLFGSFWPPVGPSGSFGRIFQKKEEAPKGLLQTNSLTGRSPGAPAQFSLSPLEAALNGRLLFRKGAGELSQNAQDAKEDTEYRYKEGYGQNQAGSFLLLLFHKLPPVLSFCLQAIVYTILRSETIDIL